MALPGTPQAVASRKMIVGALKRISISAAALVVLVGPSHSEGAESGCHQISAAIQASIRGKMLTPVIEQQILADSGAKQIRVLSPNAAATMDARQDRVNVKVDDQGQILIIWCDIIIHPPL